MSLPVTTPVISAIVLVRKQSAPLKNDMRATIEPLKSSSPSRYLAFYSEPHYISSIRVVSLLRSNSLRLLNFTVALISRGTMMPSGSNSNK